MNVESVFMNEIYLRYLLVVLRWLLPIISDLHRIDDLDNAVVVYTNILKTGKLIFFGYAQFIVRNLQIWEWIFSLYVKRMSLCINQFIITYNPIEISKVNVKLWLHTMIHTKIVRIRLVLGICEMFEFELHVYSL